MRMARPRSALIACVAGLSLWAPESFASVASSRAITPDVVHHLFVQARVAQRPATPPPKASEANRPRRQLDPDLERRIGDLVGDGERRPHRVPSATADQQACSFGLFVAGLIRSDMFLWMKEHKDQLVFMPGEEARRMEEAARFRFKQDHARRFFAGLMDLNTSSRTLALVFGEDSIAIEDQQNSYRHYICVWLADQSGIRASSFTSGEKRIDKSFLEGLWFDLRVDVRSAARSPRKLSSGETCEKAESVTISDEHLSKMNGALREIGEQLIPARVARVLEREGGEGARLYIVPAQLAQKVPFAALPLGGGHLIDKFAVMIAPASGVIGDLSNEPDGARAGSSAQLPQAFEALVVGDPELKWDRNYCWPKLPFARKEAEFTATARNAKKVLLGPQATFETVSAELKARQKSLRYIHFATHGISDEVDPADKSFLALNKKHLSGAELRKLKLKFESKPIIVMSACHSGSGKSFPGGVFGLTDFWWFAGASQVVVSLWAVDDQGTNRLMTYFETALSENFKKEMGKNGAEFALAEAMRKLKSEERDPTIWSSFAVIGKPLAVTRATPAQFRSDAEAGPAADAMRRAAAQAFEGYSHLYAAMSHLERSEPQTAARAFDAAALRLSEAGQAYIVAAMGVSNRPIDTSRLREPQMRLLQKLSAQLGSEALAGTASLLRAYGHSFSRIADRLRSGARGLEYERGERRQEQFDQLQYAIDQQIWMGTLISILLHSRSL
jgi:hypothetical protein